MLQHLLNCSFLQLFREMRESREVPLIGQESWIKEKFRIILIRHCVHQYLEREALSAAKLESPDFCQGVWGETSSPRQLIESIRRLPPLCRMVFNLWVIDGFTHEDISGLLQITEDLSREILGRSRDWFRTPFDGSLSSALGNLTAAGSHQGF
jgi:RNA polymerase sigma-70 factor (ECF subfamily)